MDRNSLQGRFEQIYHKEDELIGDAQRTISEAQTIENESNRVSEVAHNSEAIMQEIERDFASLTGIVNSTDLSFLSIATVLQCLRCFLLNKLTERTPEGNNKFENWAHKLQDKAFGEESKIPNFEDFKPHIYDYYVPFYKIVGTYTVPYDAIAGTRFFDVSGSGGGLSARSHRYRTLGHDPILGFVFGTANILTSTMTNWQFRSFFVNESNVVIGNASTVAMFEKVAERISKEPNALGAAVIKQSLHLLSDTYTTNGIPLPVIQTLSPQLAQQLGEFGLDTGGLIKAGASAKITALIDSLIAAVHGLYWDEAKCSLRQYEVRTRKILMVSKSIAEGSNIIATAVTRNVHNLDLGGIIYTFCRLLKDIDFITEIKIEYMGTSFNKVIMGEQK